MVRIKVIMMSDYRTFRLQNLWISDLSEIMVTCKINYIFSSFFITLYPGLMEGENTYIMVHQTQHLKLPAHHTFLISLWPRISWNVKTTITS